jgi:hypothetical protein
MTLMTGGCACGRVRFVADIDSVDAELCHCRMCQRASGNVSLALVGVRQDAIVWASEPDWYDSSAIAQRPFCSRCGSSLGFRYREGTEKMDLTVASFDDPSAFVPKYHFGAESLHEAWIDTGTLPRQRSEDYAQLQQRWADAGAEPPR